MTDLPSTLSCGVVILRETAAGWRVLMLRAYSNWGFPKGIREKGEAPLAAAQREVQEEAGIEDLQFVWGESYFDTGPYNHGKVARYFLARSETETVVMSISPTLGRPEHIEHRWLSLDDAFDIGSPRVRAVVHWARQIVGA